ncbi:MAG: phage tail tube protein [Gemmatimonadota bacterium]
MSDTNRVAIRAVKEGSFGVVPLTPDLRQLCITGAPNLAFTPETVVSEKIRDDRQIDDLALVGGEAAGDINSELAFRVHDILLEGAFFSTFQQRYVRENDATATEVTNVDGTAEEFDVTDEGTAPVVDDIVRAEGFTNAANNGFHIVTGAPTNTTVPVTSNLVDETPPSGAQLHVVGRRGAAGDIDATATPNTLTSVILDFTTLGLEPGDWIKLAGFTGNPANDDFVRIATIATNLIVLDLVPTGWAADTPAGAVDIFLGERLKNGVLFQSYTLETEYQDHTPVTFQYFRGMVIDGAVITAAPQAIVTTSFTFSGRDSLYSDATDPTTEFAVDGAGKVAGATNIPLPPLQVLNSSSNVGRIARGGVPITGKNFVLEASFEIANNLRQLNAVGFLGAVDIGVGEFSVTGSLNTYFDDKSLAEDVVNNTETSFDVRFEDNDSHVVVIDAPRIKFSEGAPEIPGKNADVTIPLAYQAIREPTLNYTLKYTRFNGVQ